MPDEKRPEDSFKQSEPNVSTQDLPDAMVGFCPCFGFYQFVERPGSESEVSFMADRDDFDKSLESYANMGNLKEALKLSDMAARARYYPHKYVMFFFKAGTYVCVDPIIPPDELEDAARAAEVHERFRKMYLESLETADLEPEKKE